MSTNHTPNFNLCQWEPSDPVLRTDFNEDNAKLDSLLQGHRSLIQQNKAALTTLQNTAYTTSFQAVVFGSYVGDGTQYRTISLGFRPRAVLVLPLNGHMGGSGGSQSTMYSGMALDGLDGGTGSASSVSASAQVANPAARRSSGQPSPTRAQGTWNTVPMDTRDARR